jgi:hypothetical protein
MELDGAGLTVGTSKASHELLKQLLGRLESPHRKRQVNRGGWHQMNGGMVYVQPSGSVFGTRSDTQPTSGANRP